MNMSDPNETRDEDAAVERLTQKVKDGGRKPDEPEAVRLDDDDEPAAAAEPSEPGKPPRKDRRQARFREMEDRARQGEERARVLEAQLAAREAQLSFAQQQQQQREQPPERDEIEERIRAVRDRKRALLLEHDSAVRANGNRALAPDVQGKFEDRAHDLDLELHEAAAERVMRRNAPKPKTAMQQMRDAWMAQHADVFANPQSARYFQGAYMQARAMGAPDSVETATRVMGETRKALRIGVQPTQTERSRYTGVGGGRSSGASGDDGGGRVFRPSKADAKMAAARYPNMSEADALKAYAKNLAKKAEGRASEKTS